MKSNISLARDMIELYTKFTQWDTTAPTSKESIHPSSKTGHGQTHSDYCMIPCFPSFFYVPCDFFWHSEDRKVEVDPEG